MAESLTDLLAAQPLFAGLPAGAAELVAGCGRNVAIDRDRLLVAEGDDATTLYLIRRGLVAVEVHGPDRGSLVVDTVGPDQVVGWSWLVPPYRWTFDARAVEPVGAIAIDGACLRGKADEDPAFGYALLQRISTMLLDRLQSTRLQLLDLYGDDGRR